MSEVTKVLIVVLFPFQEQLLGQKVLRHQTEENQCVKRESLQ